MHHDLYCDGGTRKPSDFIPGYQGAKHKMVEKIRILERLSFYKRSAPKIRSEIENACVYLALPQGKLLFIEGDACSNVGFVGEGSIRVSKVSETGKEVTLYYVNPGEGCVLNLSCAFSNQGYPATASTDAPTEMVIFPAPLFQDWLAKPEIRDFVFNLFSQRLAQVITLVEEIVFRKMDQRLAEFLWKRFDNEGRPRRVLHVTQDKIAAEMGTAREVVNRLLREFERVGAIRNSRGKITLHNEYQLKEFFPG